MNPIFATKDFILQVQPTATKSLLLSLYLNALFEYEREKR